VDFNRFNLGVNERGRGIDDDESLSKWAIGHRESQPLPQFARQGIGHHRLADLSNYVSELAKASLSGSESRKASVLQWKVA